METFHSKLLGLLVKPRIVTIKMKATKQYFPVVLFIMLHKAVPTFGYVDEIVVESVLFIMLNKVVLT